MHRLLGICTLMEIDISKHIEKGLLKLKKNPNMQK